MSSHDYKNKEWQEKMQIKLNFKNCMKDFIDENNGIDYKEIEDTQKKFSNQMKKLFERDNYISQWRDLPFNQNEIVDDILNCVKENVDSIENFVVFGIGGSALGPLALHNAINHMFYNELSYDKRKFPKFYVVDNIDPERLISLFDVINVEKSLFCIISKSGNTSETVSQFLIIKEILENKLGIEKAKKSIVCITGKNNGFLVKVANENKYKIFYIPEGVGGRFSELSPVGLLPAAFTGIDIKELLAGANFMRDLCQKNCTNNIAYMYAAINYILNFKKSKSICVMMPYADSLKLVADWYAQIWAESLGKALDKNKNIINAGQTPIKALGVTDQHSQVQLYNEGPNDKVIVFICVNKFRKEIHVPKIIDTSMQDISFLSDVSHNKLINIEQFATEFTLTKLHRPNMKIILPEINEFTMGELFYMFEMATAYSGEFLNINAFDQPGVEEAKNITYALLGKKGYENKKSEVNANNTTQESKYKI
jgi:glucose-6-phosphate isomerase